jgi:hypothetical protein
MVKCCGHVAMACWIDILLTFSKFPCVGASMRRSIRTQDKPGVSLNPPQGRCARSMSVTLLNGQIHTFDEQVQAHTEHAQSRYSRCTPRFRSSFTDP